MLVSISNMKCNSTPKKGLYGNWICYLCNQRGDHVSVTRNHTGKVTISGIKVRGYQTSNIQ